MSDKTVKVHLKVNKKLLGENPELEAFYNEDDKLIEFQMSHELPDDFIEDLEELVNDERINVTELIQISPLVAAVNELQQLKHLTYEPEIEIDELNKDAEKIGVKFALSDENDIQTLTYTTIDQDSYDKDKAEKMLSKVIDDAHNESYQDYKDAKKVLGAFNTALSAAKKTMKEPFQAFIKKIDGTYNLFKGQYDSTYNAINDSFKPALDYEQKKKDEAQAKKEAAIRSQAKEVEEQNKELTEKLENQSKDMEEAQLFNRVKYTVIGGPAGKLLSEKHTWTREFLEEKLDAFLAYTFESFLAEHEITLEMIEALGEERHKELEGEYINAQSNWVRILGEELAARELKKTVEKYQDNDDLPDFAQQEQPAPPIQQLDSIFAEAPTEDAKFSIFIQELDRKSHDFTVLKEEFEKIEFSEEPHAKKRDQIVNQLFPKIVDMIDKTVQYADKHYTNYVVNHKNNQ